MLTGQSVNAAEISMSPEDEGSKLLEEIKQLKKSSGLVGKTRSQSQSATSSTGDTTAEKTSSQESSKAEPTPSQPSPQTQSEGECPNNKAHMK